MAIKKFSDNPTVITSLDFTSDEYTPTEQDSAMAVILESNKANEYARYTTQNSRTSTETEKPASGNAVKLNKDEIDTLAKLLVEIYDDTYTFVSIAYTDTDPGSHSADRAWIAAETGTYTNFGSLSVTEGQLIIDDGTDYNTAQVDARLDALETYVDQSVVSGSSPTFDGANITGVDAANIDIADAGSRYTATDAEEALQEIAGSGRTTETVKGNADDISNLETFTLSEKAIADQRYNTLLSKYNQAAGETYGSDDIYQYASVGTIGDGYDSDNDPLDVSANVVDGDFQSLAVQGMTATNEAPLFTDDGSGQDGDYTYTNTGSESISDGVQTFTATAQNGGVKLEPSYAASDVFYVSVIVDADSSDVELYVNDGVDTSNDAHTGGGTAETLSVRHVVNASATTLEIWVRDKRTSGWTAITAEELNVHNTTNIGLNAITDTDLLAEMLPFVDGTESVGEQGVRVVGVNLFDKSNYQNLYTHYDFIANDYRIREIQLAPNTNYHVTKSGPDDSSVIMLINVNSVVNSGTFFDVRTGTPRTFTTSSDGKLYIGTITAGDDINNARLETALIQINIGSSALSYQPYNSQTRFLPAVGNRLPNGTVDEIREADIQVAGQTVRGFEHVQRVSTPQAVASGVAVNTTNYPTAEDGGQWYNILDAGGSETGVVGTDSTTGAGTLYFELATAVTTTYSDIPTLSAVEGGSFQRFPGTEDVMVYSSGLTFSYDILTVLHCYKLSSGVVTDVTDDCSISTDTVTITSASDGDIYLIGVEYDKYDAMGALVHAPPVSNMASRLEDAEAELDNYEVVTESGVDYLQVTY